MLSFSVYLALLHITDYHSIVRFLLFFHPMHVSVRIQQSVRMNRHSKTWSIVLPSNSEWLATYTQTRLFISFSFIRRQLILLVTSTPRFFFFSSSSSATTFFSLSFRLFFLLLLTLPYSLTQSCFFSPMSSRLLSSLFRSYTRHQLYVFRTLFDAQYSRRFFVAFCSQQVFLYVSSSSLIQKRSQEKSIDHG
jgi:hypothetical protein